MANYSYNFAKQREEEEDLAYTAGSIAWELILFSAMVKHD